MPPGTIPRPTHSSNGQQKLDKNLLRVLDDDPLRDLPASLKREIAAADAEEAEEEEAAQKAVEKHYRELPAHMREERERIKRKASERKASQTPQYRVNTVKEEFRELLDGKRAPGGWHAICNYVGMTPAVFQVFIALVQFRDRHTDQAAPGRKTLSRVTGMDPSNVSHALTKITHLGILAVEREGRRTVYSFIRPRQYPRTTLKRAWETIHARCRRLGITSFKRRR